jgi:hypothetical protein
MLSSEELISDLTRLMVRAPRAQALFQRMGIRERKIEEMAYYSTEFYSVIRHALGWYLGEIPPIEVPIEMQNPFLISAKWANRYLNELEKETPSLRGIGQTFERALIKTLEMEDKLKFTNLGNDLGDTLEFVANRYSWHIAMEAIPQSILTLEKRAAWAPDLFDEVFAVNAVIKKSSDYKQALAQMSK